MRQRREWCARRWRGLLLQHGDAYACQGTAPSRGCGHGLALAQVFVCCGELAPLGQRYRGLLGTMGASSLHGAGAWMPSRWLQHCLQQEESRYARLMPVCISGQVMFTSGQRCLVGVSGPMFDGERTDEQAMSSFRPLVCLAASSSRTAMEGIF